VATVVLVLAAAGAFFGFPFVVKTLFETAGGTLGYRVRPGAVSLDGSAFSLIGLRISGQGLDAHVSRVRVEYSIWPPAVRAIHIESPRLRVASGYGTGAWTVGAVPGGVAGAMLERVAVHSGVIEIPFEAGDLRITGISVLPGYRRPGKTDPAEGASAFSCEISACDAGVRGRGVFEGDVRWGPGGILFSLRAEGTCGLRERPEASLRLGASASGTFRGMVGMTARVNLMTPDAAPLFLLLAEEEGRRGGRADPAGPLPFLAGGIVAFSRSHGLAATGTAMMPRSPWYQWVALDVHPLRWAVAVTPDLRRGRLKAHAAPSGFPVTAEFGWSGEEGDPWRLTATAGPGDVDLPALWALGGRASGLAGTLDAGKAFVSARMEAGADGWDAAAWVRVEGLALAVNEGAACEGVASEASIAASRQGDPQGPTRWEILVRWDEGAVLISPWFLDLSRLAGRVAAAGSFGPDGTVVEEFSLGGPVQGSGRGLVVGNFLAGRLPGWTEVERALRGRQTEITLSGPVETPFRLLLQEPFAGRIPFLRDVVPRGDWRLRFQDGILSGELHGAVSIAGRDFSPAVTVRAGYPLLGEGCQGGSIRWGAFTLGSARVEEGYAFMALCREQVSLSPLRISIGGGEFSAEGASLRRGGGAMAFEANGVKLSPLKVEELWPETPVPATAEAVIEKAEWVEPKVQFAGQVEIDAAGGRVVARDMWLEPFAPVPRFGAKIAFTGLDLEEISEAAGFGRITGRVDGRVDHLAVSGIQPEAFDLRLESDPEVPGPKRISLKAVENLAILGGGGAIPLFGRMFKEFGYRRIGISCSLSNDVFSLHGLIHKDGEEYLVERGLFTGVNVINRNPEGRISFRDMLDRLGRIVQSNDGGAEAPPAGGH